MALQGVEIWKWDIRITRDKTNLQPVDFFFDLFPHYLIDYIVAELYRYGQQYLASNAVYLQHHPKASANQLKGKPIVEEVKKFIA